jgi:ABC-type lipoprotein release transport system permease subunit
VLLVLVTIVGCAAPARRAMNVQPLAALRAD